MHFRFIIIFILCFCLALGASAQKLFTVNGVVFRKNTPQIIPQATINNLNRKTIVMSDELGGFHIQAALGDTLLIKKTDYAIETILVQSTLDLANLSINLQPVIHLNEVTVKDYSRKQELDNVMNDYKKKGQYYTLNPSAWSVMNSPLTGLYELFGKGPEQAKKFREYSKQELERAAVSKRYNKKLVQDVTKMPDSEVTDFMLAFTPSFEDIQVWSDYDIVSYIKKSYEYFQNNRNSLKVEKLY